MTAPAIDLWLVGIAWQLDRVRWVSSAALDAIVRRDGACMDPVTTQPRCLDESHTDRELAALLCAGCTVQDECLELELRTAGEDTVGVWGALAEDDRRIVHRYWLQRGERAEDGPEGGPRP